MADEFSELVRDSWRAEQELLRRASRPTDPANVDVDELIRFLDSALRLAGRLPPRAFVEHPNPQI